MSEQEQPVGPQPDTELKAIQTILGALEPLDEPSKERVIAYVVNRVGLVGPITSTQARAVDQFVPSTAWDTTRTGVQPPGRVVDIRSFASQKNPSTVLESVALVAFYISELAPEGERKPDISAADLTKYLKQAGLPIPARARQALLDAKNAGYLDSGSARGTYKLNAVGYNLVAHRLPSQKSVAQ